MYYPAETLKKLVEKGAILSGVIVKIDNVGYALWDGLGFDKIAEISKNYRKAGLPYPFAPKYTVASQSARFVMDVIHFLNEKDELPGLANHQEFRLLEAA
ncbi:MAG: hypothetical protein NT170_01795 [Candidatus Moranbacteria bacterium]|nr:hypothetical protein [Candidatus Moranbacteria bacterium]